MIGLINYGMGNLGSVKRTFDILNIENKIIVNPEDVQSCEKLVLPGVGNFAKAMDILNKEGWTETIIQHVNKNKPLLGICLGMQLLFEGSEESPGVLGLSVLKGFYKKLDAKTSHVPHMGWNNLEPRKAGSNFSYLSDIKADADFYFVHSYGLLDTTSKKHLKSLRGNQHFISYIEHQNFTCAQFHPEKSHLPGLTLLKNWVNS